MPHLVKGISYVPGLSRGILRFGTSKVDPESINLITQKDINTLRDVPAGIIVIDGAPLSHLMIRLRSFLIPVIIISAKDVNCLEEHSRIVLDATNGRIKPDTKTAHVLPSSTDKNTKAITADGVEIHLRTSVNNIATVKNSISAGVESIGLVRSEYFMPEDGSTPDIEYFRKTFTRLCVAAEGHPVTIRLLDITPDKLPQCIAHLDVIGGSLGMQGARLFSQEEISQILISQLAAINELREQFDIRLLIPYLVCREELHYWAEHIQSHFARPISIGAMIETPASALDFYHWFDLVDFVAIGCNDLMQCLFAADRNSAELSNYLDPYAPLLYRFLQQIAESVGSDLEKVQLCGVLSQLPGVLPILLGLGYRAFSVDVALVPHLLHIINSTDIPTAKKLANQVCLAIETHQVKELLQLNTNTQKNFFI